MKKSTKLIMTGAASLLGVALATGGAYAASGTLTVSDSPGQALKVSGVAPAANHASLTAKAHASADAKGLFGTTPTPEPTPSPTATEQPAPEPTASPVTPSAAPDSESSDEGTESAQEVEAESNDKTDVHTVTPDSAVSVDTKVDVK
ncbi:MAG: hypothetical protein JWP75_2590, partial [Frondihabitans sp.]|nr:hypothetical protein [Frondihabitans sp.]